MKKRILIISIALIGFASFAMMSCTKDCKNCKIVTKNSSGVVESEGESKEYCDSELDKVENTPTETDPNGISSSYVCE